MRKTIVVLKYFWALLLLLGAFILLSGVFIVNGRYNSGLMDPLFLFDSLSQLLLILGLFQMLIGITIYPILHTLNYKFHRSSEFSTSTDGNSLENKKCFRTKKGLFILTWFWGVLSLLGVCLLFFGVYIKNVIQPEALYGISPACLFALTLGYLLLIIGATISPVCLIISRKI